ncbi:hypothetical protein BpPP18_19610 [Weizmannia acidilactici]|nr:hypothetical protein BpPP18_19610 [Weizmannia acidilactici]
MILLAMFYTFDKHFSLDNGGDCLHRLPVLQKENRRMGEKNEVKKIMVIRLGGRARGKFARGMFAVQQ